MDSDDVIATINDLIECSMDGEFGFHASALHIRNDQTKQLLLQRAEECRRAAAELRPFVVNLGGQAEDGGSAGSAMHRGWVEVKGTLQGHSDDAILEQAERAEDKAIFRYQTAMNKELPASVRAIVERQYLGTQRNHTRIKALQGGERLAHH